jgi:hypothetical protein
MLLDHLEARLQGRSRAEVMRVKAARLKEGDIHTRAQEEEARYSATRRQNHEQSSLREMYAYPDIIQSSCQQKTGAKVDAWREGR